MLNRKVLFLTQLDENIKDTPMFFLLYRNMILI